MNARALRQHSRESFFVRGFPVSNFMVMIPARYHSQRLPGKLLLDLGGRSMVQRTYEAACASGATRVLIVTDHPAIAENAHSFGATVIMTPAELSNGTERIAEAVTQLQLPDEQVVVNLQGDEPFVPPELIDQLGMDLLTHPEADVSSLYAPLTQVQELFDPAVVKVVMDDGGFACYFSRAPIPWHRECFAAGLPDRLPAAPYWKRVGMYAYRCGFLRRYRAWPLDPALEAVEMLEQLRMLRHGARIHMAPARRLPQHGGINTAADYQSALDFVR